MIYNETNSISYHNKSYYLLLNIELVGGINLMHI